MIMKAVSIIFTLASIVGATTVDTNPSTYGTISGSIARRSVNSYKVSYLEVKNLAGPKVGEVQIQTGWVLIPELKDTPVFHLGFDFYRYDSKSIANVDLGIFWAFTLAPLTEVNPKYEFGWLRKNVTGVEINYFAGVATNIAQSSTNVL